MALVEFKNVEKYYGDYHALRDINLRFEKGQVVVLLGPSGSGKSTLIRTINGLEAVDKGSLLVNGHQVAGASQKDLVPLRKEVGMVFQQPNPFPFSIYENVIYGLRLAGIKDKAVLDEAVETSLKQAAIWDEVKDHLHESALSLSGGQQQRVCIARVLAVKPDVILLDEPTSALDPISSTQIENMLLELRDQYTIILVTHSMHQASRISDKTAFFLTGNLIEFADTKQMFLNPKEKETEDYITGRFG